MSKLKDLLDKWRKKDNPKPVPPEDLDKLKQAAKDRFAKVLTTEADKIVDFLESYGLTEEQAKELVAKILAELAKEVSPTPAP